MYNWSIKKSVKYSTNEGTSLLKQKQQTKKHGRQVKIPCLGMSPHCLRSGKIGGKSYLNQLKHYIKHKHILH